MALRDSTHLRPACVRVPLNKCPARIDPRFYERNLEQNQQLPHCCRNPLEYADISAWYTCAEDEAKGVPDVYMIHCSCGKDHAVFMVGGGKRPFWEIR